MIPRFRFDFITKNILLLSLISFLTDIASEMLYPVLPFYLASAGIGFIGIGLIEGLADATAGFSKYYFGSLSDRVRSRTIFVRLGYGVSAIAKPLMGLTSSFGVLFGVRLLDRFGKGIRTAPRDAILTSESQVSNLGKTFGFHRGFDTLGAAIGPIVALLYLYYFPGNYSQVFILALVPGILTVTLTFLLKEGKKKETHDVGPLQVKRKSIKIFWRESSKEYRRLTVGLALLALLNSSDFFILLRARELGLSDVYIIAIYILYNLSFAVFTFPVGFLGDKIGFKRVFIAGLLIFAFVYGFLGREVTGAALFVLLSIYGIFAAIQEVVGKAWLSSHLDRNTQSTGFGLSMMVNSFAFLIASVATGALWNFFGSQFAFSFISLASIPVIAYFFLAPPQDPLVLSNTDSLASCNARH